MRRVAAAFAVVVLAGCAPSEAPAPSPSPTATSATPADTPAPTPSTEPTSPSLSPTATAEPVPDPQLPTGPADTSTGGLDESVLPVPEGWERVAKEGSADEGFFGNGTWVHAVDPVLRGAGTLAVGCDDASPDLAGMVPTAVLEGTLEREGAPGIVLAMEFADEDAAARYFEEYKRQVGLCEGTVVEQVGETPQTWFGRRDLGQTWSEAAALNGDRATFIILQSDIDDHLLEGISNALLHG